MISDEAGNWKSKAFSTVISMCKCMKYDRINLIYVGNAFPRLYVAKLKYYVSFLLNQLATPALLGSLMDIETPVGVLTRPDKYESISYRVKLWI